MTNQKQFDVTWVDGKREPKNLPNPEYPSGIDLNLSTGDKPNCYVTLQYPAPRIGYYSVHCNKCGNIIAVTTAGRPDDPRSVRIACKLQ